MPDITQLLTRYAELANEANDRQPNSSNIETMLKEHIRELAKTGGVNKQSLFPGNEALGKAANFGCPENWIHCADGSCVPQEVGCGDETAQALHGKP